jgi:hypothetical protein
VGGGDGWAEGGADPLARTSAEDNTLQAFRARAPVYSKAASQRRSRGRKADDDDSERCLACSGQVRGAEDRHKDRLEGTEIRVRLRADPAANERRFIPAPADRDGLGSVVVAVRVRLRASHLPVVPPLRMRSTG